MNGRLATIAAAVFILNFGQLCAQSSVNQKQTSAGQAPLGLSLDKLIDQETQSFRGLMPLPLDGPVDENEYLVGPNDVFSLMVPGVITSPVQIIVSPEGILSLPNVGEFRVAGETLASVKARVERSFRSVRPSLTLFSPRQFIVSVLGAVRNPGPYIATSVLRLDKIVVLANANSASTPADQQMANNGSRRRVILRRRGFEDRRVDLDRFYTFQQNDQNPLLREGDIIVVPPRNIDQGSISVYGAVNAPGQFEYCEGDSLVMLIRIAQGLTVNADAQNVELTRLSEDARTSSSVVLNISDILRGVEPDLPLMNRDRIVVREKFDRRRDFKVHVRGEIRYPGMYPITPDSTRLSEIIDRAGGFTENAYLPAAEIERKNVAPDGQEINVSLETMLNMRMSDQLVTPEEREYYNLEAKLRRGTVAVDFLKLFEMKDRSADVFLEDGDVVFIPSYLKNVYVYGQVGRPGYVTYKEGADYHYYVSQAGGYGEEAEDGETRIIKGKTREWKKASETVIEPGDYIWVPKDIRYPTGYYLNLVSQAASFISVVLSMTVIILQLTRQ